MRSRARWSLMVVLVAGLALASPASAVEVENVWLEFDPISAYVDERVTITLRYQLDPALAEELEDANEVIDYEANWDFDGGTCVTPPADWHTEGAMWDMPGVKEVVLSGWVVVGFPDGSTLRLTGTARGQVRMCPDFSSAEVVALGFDSDHGVLMDNNTTWSDEGDLFPQPEWDPAEGRNCPISHTAGEHIDMTVRVILPEGLDDCQLMADGLFAGCSEGFTSTGEEQTVWITSEAPLPNAVGVLNETISWSVYVPEHPGYHPLGATGPHNIYLTLGPPITPIAHPDDANPHNDNVPNIPTEKRMAYVCGVCQGQSTLLGCANAIYSAFTVPPLVFSLQATEPDPIWLMLGGVPGQCVDLAFLMQAALQLIGGDASVGFVYGSIDVDCYSADYNDGYDTRTFDHDGQEITEGIMVWSGGWNDWEAVCVAAGRYYGIAVHSHTEAVEILRCWLGANTRHTNHQAYLSCPLVNGVRTYVLRVDVPPYPVPKP